MLQTWVINSSIPSVGVREFEPRTNSLPCNIHRVTFKNVKRLFGQSEAEKLGRRMTNYYILRCVCRMLNYQKISQHYFEVHIVLVLFVFGVGWGGGGGVVCFLGFFFQGTMVMASLFHTYKNAYKRSTHALSIHSLVHNVRHFSSLCYAHIISNTRKIHIFTHFHTT